MKRPYKKDFVSRTYPLFFWRKCAKCGFEFRRERGWSTTRIICGCDAGKIYLCSSCASTKPAAESLLLSLIMNSVIQGS